MGTPELIHSIPIDFWMLRTRIFTAECGASVHRDDARKQLHLDVTCPRCLAIGEQDEHSLLALREA